MVEFTTLCIIPEYALRMELADLRSAFHNFPQHTSVKSTGRGHYSTGMTRWSGVPSFSAKFFAGFISSVIATTYHERRRNAVYHLEMHPEKSIGLNSPLLSSLVEACICWIFAWESFPIKMKSLLFFRPKK